MQCKPLWIKASANTVKKLQNNVFCNMIKTTSLKSGMEVKSEPLNTYLFPSLLIWNTQTPVKSLDTPIQFLEYD